MALSKIERPCRDSKRGFLAPEAGVISTTLQGHDALGLHPYDVF